MKRRHGGIKTILNNSKNGRKYHANEKYIKTYNMTVQFEMKYLMIKTKYPPKTHIFFNTYVT